MTKLPFYQFIIKGVIMKAKIFATCLTIFALVGQSAYALPKASGAGANIEVRNSSVDNTTKVDKSENASICTTGVGVCNATGNKNNLSGAGANIEVTNSRVKNDTSVSNSKNATVCTAGVGVCNMDTKR